MPDQDEVARRIQAARTVRDIKQAELDEALYQLGEGDFGKGDVGRIERGDMPLGPARRRALAELLRVPESWFTADDPFVVPPNVDTQAQLDAIQRGVAEVLERVGDQSIYAEFVQDVRDTVIGTAGQVQNELDAARRAHELPTQRLAEEDESPPVQRRGRRRRTGEES